MDLFAVQFQGLALSQNDSLLEHFTYMENSSAKIDEMFTFPSYRKGEFQ